MAKQSSLFNFFTKSPPLAVKAKSNPSPVEADAVSRSNTSPKEEAKVNSKKTPPKPAKSQAKAGHAKLFGEKAATAKERYSNCISMCNDFGLVTMVIPWYSNDIMGLQYHGTLIYAKAPSNVKSNVTLSNPSALLQYCFVTYLQ